MLTKSGGSLQLAPVGAKRPAEGLRIALFSGNYNCVRDGANRALNRLSGFLLEQGAAVRTYSPTVDKPAFTPVGELVSVPSIALPGRREYRLALGLTRRIRADIRRFRPSHFHLSAPDLLGKSAQRFARRLGVPVVTSLHTRFESYLGYYGLGMLVPAVERHLKTFYDGSDVVLAPNEPTANDLREQGISSPVRIWGRGVDAKLFSPERRDRKWRSTHGYGDTDVVVLFFGRLVREKGLETFVQVVRDLRQRGLHLRPLIVGEGPERGWLEEQLPSSVFTGHLDGEELGRAVASADILLNPSTTEAFGNVNLEAMAAGLAVVSADVGSARALIVPGSTGVLVSPSKPNAFADAVANLVRSPPRRRALGAAAVAEAASYRWPEILESVLDVYRNSPF